MTTIAYRAGVLASDSRAMIGGWKCSYPLPKLMRMKDGAIAGVVGEYAKGMAFIEWLNGPRDDAAPEMVDATVIKMDGDGSLAVYENGHRFPVTADFAAWGSGAPPALGALYAGASAERAVEIASLVDDQTGGEVVTMKCGD